MEQWYDKEEDIVGVHLKDRHYWKSIELPNGIIIDISKEGEIIGMEIHNASKVLSHDIKRLINSAKSSD